MKFTSIYNGTTGLPSEVKANIAKLYERPSPNTIPPIAPSTPSINPQKGILN
jgi:hypothetical protein